MCQGIPRRGSDGRISKWLGTCTDIQDQKLAERKLRHTRERFRLLVEGVKEYAIYMLDPDGDIVSWNAGAERIRGYSAREVIGRHCSLFYTPEDIQRDKPNQELKEAAAKGSAEDEGWRQRKDGSRFWASVVVTALRDEAGQLRGFAKVTRDMTERRRAEEGLRRYEELVKNAPIGLIVLHLEKMGDARTFRILAANPAVIQINRMQGATVSDLIGKTLVEAFPALFKTKLPELYAAVIRSGTARYVEEIPYRDERVPEGIFDIHAFPLPNQCVGIAFDNITERKQAEEKLRVSEARNRLIVDTAYDAFIAMDTDGRITDWNHQAEVIFGWPRQEALGRLLAETIIPEQYREAHREGLKRFLVTGEGPVFNKRLEMTAVRRDGNEFPVELTITPVQLGTTYLFSAFLRDITERRRAEDELKRTTDELTRSNSELGQFAYVASHDLQEPLRMVASSTQLLAREYKDKLDAEAQEYIGYAVEGAKRMQVLINQLLNYSRLGARRKPFESVDCQKIYAAAVANLKVAIEESGAVLTSGPLPTVLGDDVQLAQVFQNLLANAIKFQRKNRPQIYVSAEQKEGEWQFAVRDNGIGIDPKQFDRLFGIFQRLHSRDEYSGTGMGLAICKKIVEQHGGRIWVESKVSKGSTFYFTIPMSN
ncbi:MAG: hypothetical protein DME26_04190 [Verrucomicrobia bacterium]|nr:MAG: hypothetical protein DME26_04190 [Verrucomicrobiota bacterium]